MAILTFLSHTRKRAVTFFAYVYVHVVQISTNKSDHSNKVIVIRAILLIFTSKRNFIAKIKNVVNFNPNPYKLWHGILLNRQTYNTFVLDI